MQSLSEFDIKYMTDFKNRRSTANITLREVEEKTGISNSYLSQLENGIIDNPSFKVVVTLHNFYKSLEL